MLLLEQQSPNCEATAGKKVAPVVHGTYRSALLLLILPASLCRKLHLAATWKSIHLEIQAQSLLGQHAAEAAA